MTRSSVDFPQPDGPMSDTNSPGATSRSMPRRATVWLRSRPVKTLSTPAIRTIGPATGGASGVVMGELGSSGSGVDAGSAAEGEDLRDAHDEEEQDAEHRRDEDRRPQLLGSCRVVLVERRDDAAQALLDRAGVLADDRADDRGRGGDLERREQVGHRCRQPKLD